MLESSLWGLRCGVFQQGNKEGIDGFRSSQRM